jgi:hypothetical protein
MNLASGLHVSPWFVSVHRYTCISYYTVGTEYCMHIAQSFSCLLYFLIKGWDTVSMPESAVENHEKYRLEQPWVFVLGSWINISLITSFISNQKPFVSSSHSIYKNKISYWSYNLIMLHFRYFIIWHIQSIKVSIQTGQPQNLLHVQCRKHCSVRDRLLLVLTRTSSRVGSPPLKRSGPGVPPRGETLGSPDSKTENQPKKSGFIKKTLSAMEICL